MRVRRKTVEMFLVTLKKIDQLAKTPSLYITFGNGVLAILPTYDGAHVSNARVRTM